MAGQLLDQVDGGHMTFDPDYDAGYPAVRQSENWTCAACSWGWLSGSIGVPTTEYEACVQIGMPQNINPSVGLTDASGASLAAAYSSGPRSWPSHYSAITWLEALALAEAGPLIMGGAGWYHWTAVRGTSHGILWLANPSPNYLGVGDDLDEGEWNAYGPWNAVWLAA
jgi:hypothetical protein